LEICKKIDGCNVVFEWINDLFILKFFCIETKTKNSRLTKFILFSMTGKSLKTKIFEIAVNQMKYNLDSSLRSE
jgi:hypothetical protein